MKSCLQGYINFLESLSPDNVEQLYEYVAEGIVFSDPFNKISGSKAYVDLLKDMFEKLDDVQFTVYESLYQEKDQLSGNLENNNTAYLYWNFSANSGATGKLNFDGSSRLVFNQDGKISSHQDFWDGLAVFQKIPILGAVLRIIKNKVSAHKD
jgi:predicted ester cyclase